MKQIIKAFSYFMISMVLVGCGNSSTNKADSTFPSKSVKIIIPYSAGGGSDLSVRALAEASKPNFPKNISVENRTGGAGIVGMLYGSKAKADGYTITMIAPEILILPHMGAGAGLVYTDLKPIIMFNTAYSALTVHKNSPYNTLEEFLTAAKTEDIQIGNSGVGSIWTLAAAGLAQATDVKFTQVPFEGSAPAIADLLGGHIDAVSVSYAEVVNQVEAGELKVLAAFAPQRMEEAPSIPTAKELGYDVVIGTWRALAVPKDTPDDIVATLYDIFSETVKTPEFKKFMKESNNAIEVLSGEELTLRMQQEDILYKNLVESLNFNK